MGTNGQCTEMSSQCMGTHIYIHILKPVDLAIFTIETLFQIPLVNVGILSCAVLVYGAQSHPPAPIKVNPQELVVNIQSSHRK